MTYLCIVNGSKKIFFLLVSCLSNKLVFKNCLAVSLLISIDVSIAQPNTQLRLPTGEYKFSELDLDNLKIPQTIKLDDIPPDLKFNIPENQKWKVSGSFQKSPKGTIFVKPDGKIIQFPKDFKNPAEISPLYTGKIEITLDKNGTAEVGPRSNPALQQAEETLKNIQGDKLRQFIGEDIRWLETKLLEPPVGKDIKIAAKEVFDLGAANILQSFMRSPEAEREANLEQVGLLYIKLQEKGAKNAKKANYGPQDNYSPESYENIIRISKSVAAVRQSGRVVGTAFHLGNDIMLTAKHNLHQGENGPEVSLGKLDFYFGSTPSVPDPSRSIPFGTPILKGDMEQGDDFAIILARKKNAPTPTSLNIPALSVSNTEIGQYSSVCVLGFREGGDMTVVDGAHVILPYEFNEQEYTDLTLRLAGEMALERYYAEAPKISPGKEAERASELDTLKEAHKQLINKFKTSIKKINGLEGSEIKWELRSNFLMNPNMPAFALDSNTYGGHSGGPILNRHSFQVEGLFCRGMPDDPAPMRAGLERHEEAIPIAYILRAWKRAYPDEKHEYACENFGFHNITLD